MPPKNRVIIDTDPGVDDVLAILLALSSPASELETLLISVSFGNVGVQDCTRNVVAIFQILEKEIEWRKQQGLPVGFDGMTKFKPIIAIGANEALHDRVDSKDDFHGSDGLGGIYRTHPEYSPAKNWLSMFTETSSTSSTSSSSAAAAAAAAAKEPTLTRIATEHPSIPDLPPADQLTSFTPSRLPAHKEILRLLRNNEPDTITLISIGPLTNFALAAAEDPITFLRAKQVITMGGAVDSFGNVTPVAEFNVAADPVAAARVYALSSLNPSYTMPKSIIPGSTDDAYSKTLSGIAMPPYPSDLGGRTQRTILMSLDITEGHVLTRRQFTSIAAPLAEKASPLAQWSMAFMKPMLDKMERLHIGHDGEGAALALHDPMTVYYLLTQTDEGDPDVMNSDSGDSKTKGKSGWKASPKSPEDIRVETEGRWTKGMTVGDRRLRKRRNSDGERPHDRGNWLGNRSGNRIWRMLESPGGSIAAAEFLMQSIYGTGEKLVLG